jgi:cyclohexa-1,5-dienecarbonyl-CoA hydratase
VLRAGPHPCPPCYSDGVRVETQRGGAWITLEEPPRNVLTLPILLSLDAALASLSDKRDIKTVVFRSGLPGTFCAGTDVKDHTRERAPAMLDAFHGLLRRLDALPQVALAAVDGLCLGGGFELVLACDVVLATPRSSFGQPEIDLGCFPPAAAVLLPRLAGKAAADLVFTGRGLTAEDAFRVGLVTRIVQDLATETETFVATLSRKSAPALAAARKALRRGTDGSFTDALARSEAIYRDEVLPTLDAEEGVAAFLAKRPPRWQDR